MEEKKCCCAKTTSRSEEQKKKLLNRFVVRDIRDGKDEVVDELIATIQKLMK